MGRSDGVKAEASMTGVAGATGADRQERRRARTRERLIAAARRLMSAKGVEATTIAEIAEEADLGFGTFYNYFDSKEAVLDAVIAEAVRGFAAELGAAVGPLVDPAELLAAGLRYTIAAVDRDPVWGWLVVRIGLSNERLGLDLRRQIERGLRLGVGAGRFVPAVADTAVWAIGGATLAFMRARLEGSAGPEAGSELAEFVLRALGLPADEAARIARLPMPAELPGGETVSRKE